MVPDLEYHSSGRPKRPSHLPKRYRDIVPEPQIPIERPLMEPDLPEDEVPAGDHWHSDDPEQSSSEDDNSAWVKTDSDAFDLFRQYQKSFPTYDPENMVYFGQFCDAPTFDQGDSNPGDHQPWYSGFSSLLGTANHQYFAPFLNATTYRLMSWFYNSSSSKSLGDLDQLVNDVILAEDFDQEELRNFSAAREGK